MLWRKDLCREKIIYCMSSSNKFTIGCISTIWVEYAYMMYVRFKSTIRLHLSPGYLWRSII